MPDTAGYAASSLGEDSSKLRRQREVYEIRNPAQPSPAHATPIQDHSQPGQLISRESVQPNQKNAKNSKKRLRNDPIFGTKNPSQKWDGFWPPINFEIGREKLVPFSGRIFGPKNRTIP